MTAPDEGSPAPLVVFTIVSANYLAYARTLMRSVRTQHPEADRFVFLADEPANISDHDDLFTLIPARELNAPHYDHLAFRYSILEFNTALKPFAFRWLGQERPAAAIVYLDPDIFVLSPLGLVAQALEAGALAVLTPHLDAPLSDGKYPDETTFLRVGIYNLGFIAVGVHQARPELLDWWADRLEHGAYVDLESGTFTDQKWMDLVPGLFQDVHVLRHPGYNLAYWNLAVRPVAMAENGTLLAGGERVAFVHFSGVDLAHPQDFSKYQNRYDSASIGALRPTYDAYLDSLRREGHERLSRTAYSYDRLADGTKITPEMRATFRYRFDIGRPDERKDPFALTSNDFARAAPISARVSRRALEGYRAARRRPYVRVFMDRLGPRARLALRRRVVRAATPSSVRVAQDMARATRLGYPLTRPSGADLGTAANVIGYFEGEFGVAEAARQLAQAAEVAGVEVARIGVDAGHSSRQRDRSVTKSLAAEPAHPVNIICVNADQTELVAATLGDRVLSNRYNIGFWFWELSQFPDEWLGALDVVDEVWVATEFVRKAVAAKTDKPVRTIGVAVDATPSRRYSREDFGLPSDRFTFLFSFDFASYPARKNPAAVVDAFRKAFPGGSEPASLVLKSINGHRRREAMAGIQEHAKADGRIVVMDGFLTRDEVFGLESVADAYVSLHRSEGFGLGLAESMSLGKPVIGTAYSGNLDFMNGANSCLVGYQLVSVGSNEYPSYQGQVWAEPDIDHAAYFMARIAQDVGLRTAIGQTAMTTIHRDFGYGAIGARVAASLPRM